jgi:hypothetical protein
MSSSVTQALSSIPSANVPQVSVKQQVIQDLKMAGLSPLTQKMYLEIILRFVRRTGLRPQDASEAQVAGYLREMIGRGLGAGTIIPTKSALRFLFCNTLQRQWDLFKKGSPLPAANACPILRTSSNVAA